MSSKNHLWKGMQNHGIDNTYIRAIKSLYEDKECRIKNVQNYSELFKADNGLSPTLFKLYVY